MNRRDQKQKALAEKAQAESNRENAQLEAFARYGKETVAVCRKHPDSSGAQARLTALLNAAQHSHDRVEKPYENWRRAGIAAHYYVEAAFPGLFATLARLRQNEASDVAPLLIYLEADPYFFHSGFLAVFCIRHLKRAALTPDQLERIQALLLRIVQKGDRREFRHYCRLARRVNTSQWEATLQEFCVSADRGIARRARWMLAASRQR